MASRLLLLNGVAILCVILFHATGFGFTAMFSWAHRYREVVSPNYDDIGTPAYYALRLVEQFVVMAIPSFLFVSGYFVSVLAGRNKASVEPKAMRSRIKALGIPYLLWSAVVLVGFALEGRIFSERRYLSLILTGASNPNYYYVPLLVQLYLVAPLIVRLVRWNWRAMLAVTGTWQLLLYAAQYAIILGAVPPDHALVTALPKWLFLVHVFWFTAGMIVGFEHQAFRQVLERMKRYLLPAAVVFYAAGFVEWELLLRWSGLPWTENRATLIDGLYAGTLLAAFLAYADVKLPFSNVLVSLGAQSYGIYLVHGLVMEYFSRGLYHFAPWVLSRQLVFQPLLIIIGLAVPLVMMNIFRRAPARGLYSYVFG